MTPSLRRFPLVVLAATAVAALAACAAPTSSSPAPAAAAGPAAASSAAPAAAQPTVARAQPESVATPPAANSTVTLVVPKGESGGALSTPRKLKVPKGWTARVWARVPGARIEVWTPQGDLLVSSPTLGKIMELKPDAAGTAKVTTLLSGLTYPQGLAFAMVNGHRVLYVAESSRIDAYPWQAGKISGARTVIARNLPDLNPTGDDVHRAKDIAIAPDGTVYFTVGSSTNASPVDRTMKPQRATIMSVRPDGTDLKVVERGVRNGEGLATAPNGTVWTAINERDQIPYPQHKAYGGYKDAFGKVIPAYVNNHPPEEVVPVTQGRDVGWPYCDPDQDLNKPKRSLADVPLIANALTNPGGKKLNCKKLASIEVGLPAHSAPLGLAFLEGSKIPLPWRGGAVIGAHGSWDRTTPRSPAVLWLAWDAARHTLKPAVTLIGGFEQSDGSYWGRPVDAVPSPNGALFVSDDTAGAIYRLAPASVG